LTLRIAIFGSFYRGEQLIRAVQAFQQEHPGLIELCGIATDDPFHKRTSPDTRVWQYCTHAQKLERVETIERLANEAGVPFWNGSVKGPGFAQLFQQWNPDIVYMGTFGQRLPPHIFNQPKHGILNFHPAVDHRPWPNYVGGDPFRHMLAAGERHGAMALHAVNEKFDDGPLVAFSANYRILPGDTVVSLHQRTSVEAGKMVEWHLRQIFGMPQPRYAVRSAKRIRRPLLAIA
jgi:methionyl-tRNA formyltransferase